MGYDSKHIKVLDPKAWYNLIAQEYKEYHKHLDSFEKGVFVKFLPKGRNNLDIIDLGAGDGRLYKYLSALKPKRYVACDIAEDLLHKHAGKEVEKIVCDLESKLPWDDESFDVATSFFVLEHINDTDQLISEVYRILKPWWTRIIGHFLQRREFLWSKDEDQFKIQMYNHRIQDLEKIAQHHFFDTKAMPIFEGDVLLGYILICDKH